MSAVLDRIKSLVEAGKCRVSEHAYEELYKDGILAEDVIVALPSAEFVEDYPDANRGPSVLALCELKSGRFVHSVWGIHKANPGICVLITAYMPDPKQWSDDLLRRVEK